MKIVSVGEVLWDVIGKEEHLGGAPLNFAAHAARLGHQCFLISAVGADGRGRLARARIEALGLPAEFLGNANHATGYVTVEVSDRGEPTFTIHRPAAYDFPTLDSRGLTALVGQRPDWIYYGTLAQAAPAARQVTRDLCEALPQARRFYDVNLRPNCYTRELVEELLSRATVVKLNEAEVGAVQQLLGDCAGRDLHEFTRSTAARFGWEGVCVTLGARGCVLRRGDEYVESPGRRVPVADTVGAGDAFAAGLVHALNAGWSLDRTAEFANRLGALVASRAGGIPEWSPRELE
jgi:fructokinase